jgi:hypothetical protein
MEDARCFVTSLAIISQGRSRQANKQPSTTNTHPATALQHEEKNWLVLNYIIILI